MFKVTNNQYNSLIFSQFGRQFRVWQTNGAETGKPEITSQLRPDGTPWYDPCGKAVLYRNGNKIFANFRAREGVISLTATWHGWGLNFDVWVPRAYAGRTRGILGDFDGNSCNDFVDRAGVRLPDMCNPHPFERQIYNHMLSCKSKNYNH